MVLNRRLGKTKYYALRIEFQESNTLYIHLSEFLRQQIFTMRQPTIY